MIVLDTHALVWVVDDSRQLGRKARQLVERHWANGEVAVCAMSFWEIAMLQARGRLELPAAAEAWRADLIANGLVELPVSGAIGIRAVELAGLATDPVDQLIVATALAHRAALVTADEKILEWRHTLVRHDAAR